MALALLSSEVVVLVLVAAGVPHARLVLAVVELCVLALAVGVVVVLWRGRRVYLRRGMSRQAALARAFGDLLPARLARVLIGEARLFATLGRWITGTRPFSADATQIPYGRGLRPLLLALVPLSMMELGVVDLLLRHHTIHWVIAGISLYGVLWLIGLAGSTRVRPHTLSGNRLTLRLLVFDQLEVDLSELDGVETVRESGQKRSVQLEDEVLTLSVMGAANTQLSFREPTLVTGDREFMVRQIRFETDDPGQLGKLFAPLCKPPIATRRVTPVDTSGSNSRPLGGARIVAETPGRGYRLLTAIGVFAFRTRQIPVRATSLPGRALGIISDVLARSLLSASSALRSRLRPGVGADIVLRGRPAIAAAQFRPSDRQYGSRAA